MATETADTLIDNSIIEALKAAPPILWFIFIMVIFIIFYKRIRNDIIPKLSGFKAVGVEFSFVETSFDAAIEFGEKSDKWDVVVPEKDKKAALSRAKQHLPLFQQAKILWVDDHPENNRNERKMLRQLKADIDNAKNSCDALEMIDCEIYDLIFSDIARDDEKDLNGLDFLKALREKGEIIPVIFYVGVMLPGKGVPVNAFGLTNRPDELLHLALDALERSKY